MTVWLTALSLGILSKPQPVLNNSIAFEKEYCLQSTALIASRSVRQLSLELTVVRLLVYSKITLIHRQKEDGCL